MTRAVTILCAVLPAIAAADTFEMNAKRFRTGPNPSSVVISDLNGDGILDILTGNRGRLMDIREERPAEDHVSYLVGKPDLTFDAQPPLPCGYGPYAIAVANIDALKAPDVVVASFHAVRHRDLTLLRNIGDGLFEPHSFSVPDDGLRYLQDRDAEGQPLFSVPGLTSVAIADIDRDGYRDAVATGWSSDVLVLFPGHPDSYFDEPVLLDLAGGPRELVLRDLDGDGELDLAVALYNEDAIALLKGNGQRGFELIDRFSARGIAPNGLRYADVNGDGRGDLVVTFGRGDDSPVVFYGDGGFKFTVSQEIRLGSRFHRDFGARDAVCADFSGNGKTDIAVACPDAGAVVLLRNDSRDSSIPQRFTMETYKFGDARPHALSRADLNGDGHEDLAVALWNADAVALLMNRP